MTVLLVSFAIIALAAATYALTGFGFALVAVPLLALATDPRTAVVAVTLDMVAMAAAVAVRERGHVQWSTAAAVFAASLVGMPLGLLVLLAASERLLTGLIAVGVLGCTALVWRGLRLRGGWTTIAAVGVISGALVTSTGAAGPPVVVAFQAMGYDPTSFRATLSVLFAAMGLSAIAGFSVAGQTSAAAVLIGLIGIPAMLVGWLVGNALFQRIEPVRFRRLVLGTLTLTAAVTLLHTLAG